MRTKYIFKNGELLEYKDYVEKYGKPQQRRDKGGSTIINKSFDAYESPASGKIISNHHQRNDDMARTGCVEYEPEIKQDYQANIDAGDAKMDEFVDDHVEKSFAAMSTTEKENIHRELENTTEEYARTTVE
jgi:hypothetical protein